MYKLVIADEEGSTTIVPLVRDEVSVGRREGNTIRLTERNVSRRHAIFRKNGVGLTVEDLASYNGVKVNGKRIDGLATLKAGDQVSVGDYIIALQEDVAATAASGAGAAPASWPPVDAAPAVPRLVMQGPPEPGAEFFLGADVIRLGRGEDQDAWINHRSMSREHAEIVRRSDGFYVRDCGSQNGVRVNGEDIREALLARGDIVELGEVRFRYVAPGEHYQFDEDSTMQVSALPFADDERRSNVKISLIILAIGLPLALALALTGGDEANQNIAVANQTVATESNSFEPAPAVQNAVTEGEPEVASAAVEAVRACEASLGELRAADAVSHADRALALSPGLADAVSCRGESVALVRDEEHYRAGKTALELDDVDGAVSAFAMLAQDSPYRAQPEIDTASTQVREQRLEAAAGALGSSEWAEAERLAASVIAMQGSSTRQISEARSLQQRAQEGAMRAEAAAAAASARVAAAEARPARPEVARPRPRAPARMDSRPRSTPSVAMSGMQAAGGSNPCPLTLGLREMQACQCRLARRGNPRFARLIGQGRCP